MGTFPASRLWGEPRGSLADRGTPAQRPVMFSPSSYQPLAVHSRGPAPPPSLGSCPINRISARPSQRAAECHLCHWKGTEIKTVAFCFPLQQLMWLFARLMLRPFKPSESSRCSTTFYINFYFVWGLRCRFKVDVRIRFRFG